MIKVLHIVGRMHRAGQETFIMNLYRSIDRSRIQFDFAVCTPEPQDYDNEIRELGGSIHYITPLSKGILKHYRSLKQVIKNNGYDIVHRHTSNTYVFIDLLAAKVAGVSKRYIHSHNSFQEHRLLNSLCRIFVNHLSTERFACSKAAGEWLFGKKAGFDVIPNAIDVNSYLFDEEKRNQCRYALGVGENDFVIGHVGRLTRQKNHKKILEIYESVHQMNSHAKLLLVGDGELRIEIEEMINREELSDCVILTGSRNDIPELMMAMDCFIFPSLFEGLGIVGIEAQAAGLQCFMGETIPKETRVVDELVQVIGISESDEKWARAIVSCKKSDRRKYKKKISDAGYDIHMLARKFEMEYYI